MIKHVVCFSLKDKAKKEEAKALLLSMRGRVPAAKEIEAGTDFLGSARSYDVFWVWYSRTGRRWRPIGMTRTTSAWCRNSCTRRRSRPSRWISSCKPQSRSRTFVFGGGAEEISVFS